MDQLSEDQDPVPAPLWLHHKRALTLRGHEEVHTLQNIQEELVPAIFDALPPPANLPSHLAGDLGLLFFCLHGDRDKQQWPQSSPPSIILSLSLLHPHPPPCPSSNPHPRTHLPTQPPWDRAWRKWSKAARVEAEGTAYLMLEPTGPMWSPQEAAGEHRQEEAGRKGGECYEARIIEKGPSSLLLRNTRPPEQPIFPLPPLQKETA